jgi:hypothetical protein
MDGMAWLLSHGKGSTSAFGAVPAHMRKLQSMPTRVGHFFVHDTEFPWWPFSSASLLGFFYLVSVPLQIFPTQCHDAMIPFSKRNGIAGIDSRLSLDGLSLRGRLEMLA